MKKKFAGLFIALEFLMLALVLCTFVKRHTETGKSYGYGVYFGTEDYPLTETYEDYRQEVTSRLASGDYSSTDQNETAEENAVVESSVYSTIMGTSGTSGSFLQKLSDAIGAVETKIENYTDSQKILGKNTFIETKKKLDKLTGLDMTASLTGGQNSETDVRDVVAATEEGQLGWVQDDYDLTEELENLVDFGLQMQAEGRDFLVAENPNKYAETDAFQDYSEEKNEQIRTAFSDAGLNVLNLGEEFAEMGLTEKELFFDTDFHWKPQTGILADGLVSEYLNEHFGYDIDTSLYDSSMYEYDTQEDAFLGYLGKKVTLAYTDPDDFTVVHPKYETDYTVYNSYDGSEKTGSVEDTLYWDERLDENSLYDGNKYEFYGYSDQSLIRIHNNLNTDGKKVLVLKESFANCMVPYLAAGVEDLEEIDLRLFCGSIRDYIEATDPDTILVVYGLSSYEDDTVEEGLFDFR